MVSKKKSNQVSDGWHTIRGDRVYVEDGRVKRAMKYDRNGYPVPAQLYFRDPDYRGWTNAQGTLFTTAKSGIYRGTYAIK